ncbi:MAG: hypothetical protein B9J98_05740 [Candidatus Terraquivivens tikiterensis]|uniref:Uncharacterized protein n=1 Tax=Candidatus Terraquivivens tikiterensis TaxID=1980982 RepID=A0A2R7Y416_9ARCH|nr:MAG: hypothetical protein B9J98_05740 [Candidatus Terraquivivens tikiterensis]
MPLGRDAGCFPAGALWASSHATWGIAPPPGGGIAEHRGGDGVSWWVRRWVLRSSISEGIRRLLREIEERYSEAFVEIGPCALRHFKHMIDNIEAFLDLLTDPKTSFLVKLMGYAKGQRIRSSACTLGEIEYASYTGRNARVLNGYERSPSHFYGSLSSEALMGVYGHHGGALGLKEIDG